MALRLAADDAHLAEVRLNAANLFVQTAESQLSRFLPESDLSRLNAQSGQSVAVSSLLWQVLNAALDAASVTDGLYDPAILDALESVGYRKSFDTFGGSDIALEPPAKPRSDWRYIKMEPETHTVTLPEGLRIDLGGIAKGWVAERVAEFLSEVGPCLVDAGGDIAARGRPPEYDGWPVGVADPFHPDSDLAILSVQDNGVATSGVDYRRWSAGGMSQHHIIDPRTQRPADTDLWTATVIAPDAKQADLHAKVTLLLGSQKGLLHLSDLPGVEGILVLQDGRKLTTAGIGRNLLERYF